MTTSSDEQHRIWKAINGKNGVDKQDAIDEELDNAIDENAKYIELIFNKNILREIFNDGNPMNLHDRNNSLTLDGRSKSNKTNKKGKYGIGGFYSRCKLSGQGKQIITSKDDIDIYKCEINLEKLQDPKICPKDCWTGQHKYRPKWIKLKEETLSKYRQGVTKEYIGVNIQTNFTLEDVAKHIVKKYYKNIKNGVKIVIIWDNKSYLLPEIFQYEIKTHSIDVYNNNGFIDYYTEYKGNIVKCSSKRLTPNFVGSKEGIRIGTYKLNIGYPTDTEVKLNTKEFDSDGKKMGYITTEYINNNIYKVIKHICKNNNNIELKCGENSILYSIIDSKSDINNDAETIIKSFIPEITISMDKNTLCYKEFNRLLEMTKGGDMALRKIMQIFSIDLNFNSTETTLDLSQEDKNKVELPKHLCRIISKIIILIQKDINKELNENYNNKIKKKTQKHRNNIKQRHTKPKAVEPISNAAAKPTAKATAEPTANAAAEATANAEHVGEKKTEKNICSSTKQINRSDNKIKSISNNSKPIKVPAYNKGIITKEEADEIFVNYKNQFQGDFVNAVPLNSLINFNK